MGSGKAVSRMILFLLLANVLLFPQARAVADNDTNGDTNADSQTAPEKAHHWKFDDQKNKSSEYGEDINGQSYNQNGTVSPSMTAQSDPSAAAGSVSAPHRWSFDDKKTTASPYGVDISGKSYTQDGTVSTS